MNDQLLISVPPLNFHLFKLILLHNKIKINYWGENKEGGRGGREGERRGGREGGREREGGRREGGRRVGPLSSQTKRPNHL